MEGKCRLLGLGAVSLMQQKGAFKKQGATAIHVRNAFLTQKEEHKEDSRHLKPYDVFLCKETRFTKRISYIGTTATQDAWIGTDINIAV